ncbi:MAG: hypothetical protein DRJ31_05060 [Candidatus Methanomethylicota archaeon]|uniref:PAC2 family protein n=1 Tax=Thermoproteota archaeon TaxID=2056631 RepID=A0A497EPX8_9CREN|nr:MAG: hypothetical protein DRJ31_05060 [Candidatus Verstraetearchaeota archaeon]
MLGGFTLMSHLVFIKEVELDNAILLLGLEGYADAGGAASFTLSYLRRKLQAESLAMISHVAMQDYTAYRPIALIEGGLVKAVHPPLSKIYYAKSSDRWVVLVQGPEPSFSWFQYIRYILDLASRVKASKIFTFGGFVDWVEAPKVSAVVSKEELKNMVLEAGIGLIDYEGPCSLYTVLIYECASRGIDAISLWYHVPFKDYAILKHINMLDFRSTKMLLEKLKALTEIDVDLSDVDDDVKRLNETLTALSKKSAEARRFRAERRKYGPSYII